MINRPWSSGLVLFVATVFSLFVQLIFLLFSISLNIETTMRNIGGFSDDSNYIDKNVLLGAVASEGLINKGYWWISYAAFNVAGENYHEFLLRLITSLIAGTAVYYFSDILAHFRAQRINAVCVFFALPICLLPIVIGKEVVILALVLICLKYFIKLQENINFSTLLFLFLAIFGVFLFRYFFIAFLVAMAGVYIFLSQRNGLYALRVGISMLIFAALVITYLVYNQSEFLEAFVLTRAIEMSSEGGNYAYSASSVSSFLGGGFLVSIAKLFTYPPPITNSYLFLSYIPLVYGASTSLLLFFLSRAYRGGKSKKNDYSLLGLDYRKRVRHFNYALLTVSFSYLFFLVAINFEANFRYKIIPLSLIYLVLASDDRVFYRPDIIFMFSILVPILIGLTYSIFT